MKRCAVCAVELPAVVRVARGLDRRNVCRTCRQAQLREYARTYRQRLRARLAPRRSGLVPAEAASGIVAVAFERQRADRALDRGRCDRRCPSCYRRYHLDAFEAPCPACGDHLITEPVTFDLTA